MTDPMVSFNDPPRAERVEVITSVQRRRHWTTEEKVCFVEETYLPGQSVSLVARRHGLNANQLFTWRRLAHYNDLHPHRALGYRSPREFITRSTQEPVSGL